jgi:hypothetical protein
MKLNLPLHPSMRHPLTGEPVRALYVDKHGRARYPIMGGAPDDDPDDDKDKGDDEDKGDDPDADKDKGGDDRPKKGDVGYFPADTPRAQMSVAEQLAYDAFHGRKHEQRNKDWRTAVGGKTPEQVAADLAEFEKLKQAQMSDGEKAIDQAKRDGARQASLTLAPQLFDVALRHVNEDRRKVLIDSIDPARVIKEDGTIDTDKVTSIAHALAPVTGGSDEDPDYGNGKRHRRGSSGVSAGRAAYEAQSSKK